MSEPIQRPVMLTESLQNLVKAGHTNCHTFRKQLVIRYLADSFTPRKYLAVKEGFGLLEAKVIMDSHVFHLDDSFQEGEQAFHVVFIRVKRHDSLQNEGVDSVDNLVAFQVVATFRLVADTLQEHAYSLFQVLIRLDSNRKRH